MKIAATILFATALNAQVTLKIWPGTAPGEIGSIKPESSKTAGPVGGLSITTITDVSVPELTVFPAPNTGRPNPAVLVFPGGGYFVLATDIEGTEICTWLNQHGFTGIMLKYRVPRREGRPMYAAPLEDAQRAMGLIREHAKEWNIDPSRIGAMGFSAGAHLAAALSNNFDHRTYPKIDAADDLPCKPAFAILIYPAYLVGEKNVGMTLSPEVKPSPATPPTFIVQAEDDMIGVNNSLAYYAALANNKVPAELHLFATGGHGYGIRNTGKSVNAWPQSLALWLQSFK